MGHDTGLENNYFKPSFQDLFEEYLKDVDHLTLNEEFKLRQKLEKLEVEKTQFETLVTRLFESLFVILQGMEHLQRILE